MEEYTSKAIVTEISATSRIAIKVRDNFYTVEYTEKRAIPDVEGIDIEAERLALFDAVNGIVDAQADDILRTFQPNKK
jgi:hypothetical protein